MLPCFLSEIPLLFDVYVAGAEGDALCVGWGWTPVECGQLDPVYISAVRTGGWGGELTFIGHLLCHDRYFDKCIMCVSRGRGRGALLSVGAGTHAAWSRIDIIRDPKSSPS